MGAASHRFSRCSTTTAPTANLRCLYHPAMEASFSVRVLVVEDDQPVRTFIRFALERDGMGVVEAFDGETALQAVAASALDAVLIDGLLPDMHGVALADRLLDDPQTAGIPMCFLSGALLGHSHAPTAGFGWLAKPVRPVQLVAHVRALLEWRDGGGSPVEQRRAALRSLENGFFVGP